MGITERREGCTLTFSDAGDAGAYRVYQDPADLLRHLDEIGIRT